MRQTERLLRKATRLEKISMVFIILEIVFFVFSLWFGVFDFGVSILLFAITILFVFLLRSSYDRLKKRSLEVMSKRLEELEETSLGKVIVSQSALEIYTDIPKKIEIIDKLSDTFGNEKGKSIYHDFYSNDELPNIDPN